MLRGWQIIMIRLKKINLKNDIIEADMYYEDLEKPDHIKVDVRTQEIIELENANFYEFRTAPGHALRELIKIAQSRQIPDEKLVMWY